MIIGIGCDHAAFTEKTLLISYLTDNNHEVVNFGCDSNDSVDYPDYAHSLSKSLINKEINMGILICGSGIGMSITANRFKGIRAALCRNADDARLARQHNNANILALPGRQIDVDEAKNCFKIFINTSFDGGKHQKRVEKID